MRSVASATVRLFTRSPGSGPNWARDICSFDEAFEGDAAGAGFGGELGFDFGLEIEVDHAEERIALGLGWDLWLVIWLAKLCGLYQPCLKIVPARVDADVRSSSEKQCRVFRLLLLI
jgi:hypothetical protein